MSDRDFDFEHRPGIPAPLPAGEEVLWQGRPDAAALARDAFKVNWITGYLVAIALWRGGAAWLEAGAALALARLLPYLALALAGWAVLRLLAWAQARAAIYTITTARVILRVGAALPVTFTVPFTCIGAASLALRPDGTGNIALLPQGGKRLSWFALWPHVRPWHTRWPEPCLRAIPDAARVSRILADAAQAKVNEPRVTLRAPAPAGLVAAE